MTNSPITITILCNGCLKKFPISVYFSGIGNIDTDQITDRLSEMGVETCDMDIHWCEDCQAADPCKKQE
jgi:hypothetical protein